MAIDLVFVKPGQESTANGPLHLQFYNDIGSAVLYCYDEASGKAIADVYTLTFTNIVGNTCTVLVDTANTRNPYRDTAVGKNITFDGSIISYNVIPGVGIKFDSTIIISYSSRVSVGNYMSAAGVVEGILGEGIVIAGDSTDLSDSTKRIGVKNNGDVSGAVCTVSVFNGFYWTSTSGNKIFVKVKPHDDLTTAKTSVAGTYTVSFANYVAGSPDRVDVNINGSLTVAGAQMDSATEYGSGDPGYTSGNFLPGLEFVMTSGIGAGITSHSGVITVSNGRNFWQITQDISGSADSSGWSNNDVTLTQPGQSTGNIAVAGTAYFWKRFLTTATDSPVGNPRLAIISARGLSI